MNGKFITLEGCEGVGKSTQLRLLSEYLEASRIEALFTREPGGTAVAEELRRILLAKDMPVSPLVEAMLFASARVDNIDRVILPALDAGKLVICDRYLDSSLAYQGEARGLGFQKVLELNSYAVERCMPDCTVFIDLDPAVSWRKISGKTVAGDRLENESAEFHTKVYAGYQKLVGLYPERIVAVVPDVDKKATHEEVVRILKSRGVLQ